MDDIQYLKLLNEGLKKHRFYLPQYLKREQKKAECEFVTKDEFINRLMDIVEVLELIAKKRLTSENTTSDLSRILQTLEATQIEGLLIDWQFLERSVREAFSCETLGEPITVDLQAWAAEEKKIKELRDAIYTPKDLEKIWFKVGLLFATGEMKDLLVLFQDNATKVAQYKYGDNWKSFRPYISESASKTNISDKNIFSDSLKIEKLTQYCEHNNLPVNPLFQ